MAHKALKAHIPPEPFDSLENVQFAHPTATKRHGMSFLRATQKLLMVLGVAFLAAYFGARIQGAFSSHMAIRTFKASHSSAQAQETPPRQLSGADVTLWSEKRVEAYKQSLDQHFDPPLALLRISKLRLEAPVFDGTDDLTLNRGLGRIAGTARVGIKGNLAIAGHRDGFFRGLKDIRTGDTIDLVIPDGTETYIVDNIQIVDPTDVSVLQPASESSLTLVTCYPFYFIGSAPKRYIVHSSRVASARSAAIAQVR
jgi:sortase A